MAEDSTPEEVWARQWKRAGVALAELRARDLRSLSDETALAASNELLELALATPLPDRRREWSGLVEWQRLLHKTRP